MRRLLAVFLLCGAAAAGAADPITVPGLDGPFAGGNFVVECAFTHRAPDDPIVAPGVPGGSHDHSFFGNVGVDAFATAPRLLRTRGGCHRAQDRSAYWVPTLFENGRPVTPLGMALYYHRETWADVTVPPNGLRMIAGDPHATAPQGIPRVFWNCEANGTPEADVPVCADPFLGVHVEFPECWDGIHLDSADHRSHLAYSSDGACPSTHPVPIPAIRLVVRYPVTGASRLVLSSGSVHSAHADVFVAWRGHRLERLVRRCLGERRQCRRVDDGPHVLPPGS